MICIDRLETTDGTVYRNLFYATNWADLQYAEECETYSHLFLIKNKGSFKELELKSEDIKEISLGDNQEDNDFIVVEDNDTGETFLMNADMADELENQPTESGIDEQLADIKDFCDTYFNEVIGHYDLRDHELVVENLTALCVGYVQTCLENEGSMNDEEAFLIGFTEAIKIMAFATRRLDKSRGDALLRAHVSQIVPQYLKFVNHNPDLVRVVKNNQDAPL
jgi:hypothetical protein